MDTWISPELLATLTSQHTTAHRLYTSTTAWVERFDRDILISYQDDGSRERTLKEFVDWEKQTGFQPQRIFTRFLPRQNTDRTTPVLLKGSADLTLQTTVTERGVRYGIDFSAGYSSGLFLDQRANRAYVQQLAPKRLLNTFAYTCSFSVVAALAGALTVNIDLSKKSLARGQANFQLNQLATDKHSFLTDDVLDLLPKLERRGEKFDMIILDPPTFSLGNRGRRWRVEEQLEQALLTSLEIATNNASILISTNCSTLKLSALERMGRLALKTARRVGDFHQQAPLPDIPAESGATTLWLKLR